MSEAHYYNRLYGLHESGEMACRNSIHDLEKALSRVSRVIRYFKLHVPPNACALDVGCGLGYYSEALHEHGFQVTGVDISTVAVEHARQRFDGPEFSVAQFPEDIEASFDLIWSVDITPLNSFDISTIGGFFEACRRHLNPGGVVVIGWHTDFSGQMIPNENWAGWDIAFMGDFCTRWGLEGPAIVECRNRLLNGLAITLCRAAKKSAPVFFALKSR